MWFEPTDIISIDEDSGGSRFKLSVPSELHKYWITQNLLDSIFLEISAIYAFSSKKKLFNFISRA